MKDGELINLSLIVNYDPDIMEIIWDLNHGRAKTVEEISPGVIRVEFPTHKSDSLIRNLMAYSDYMRVDSPEEIVEEIRDIIRKAKQVYHF